MHRVWRDQRDFDWGDAPAPRDPVPPVQGPTDIRPTIAGACPAGTRPGNPASFVAAPRGDRVRDIGAPTSPTMLRLTHVDRGKNHDPARTVSLRPFERCAGKESPRQENGDSTEQRTARTDPKVSKPYLLSEARPPPMSASVPSEAFWQLGRLKIFDMTAQLQHGIKRFRRRAVREAGGQFVPPLLKLVQQVRQRLHRVSPLLWSAAPIGRPANRITTGGFAGASAAFALRRAL